MGEIKINENVEINKKAPEDYKKIKPTSNISFDRAKDIIRTNFDNRDYKSNDEPHIISKDGLTRYYDDNNKEYRVNNELNKNTEYKINGYEYKTDEQGRILSIKGKLHLKNHTGRLNIRDNIEVIGKGDQKKEDNRGHLVGDQFGGTNGLENIVAQDKIENSKDYANLENYLAKQLRNGHKVKISIDNIFNKNSYRPTAICFKYSIDGEKNMIIFPNGKEK